MLERLRGWLRGPAHRRGVVVCIILLGVALCLPSLGTGLVGDDYVQRLFATHPQGAGEGTPAPYGPHDLFLFTDGTVEGNHALKEAGAIPWTTGARVKIRFFRPLASLSHALDHRLWPDTTRLMHLQSLLYYGLALGSVWRFYRRFAGTAAILALVLYAVDDAHGGAVEWICNRNVWMALMLSLPAVVLHDRWRRDGFVHGAWLGPIAFALGLLAGESAIGVCGYLVAHALVLDRGRLWARALRLVPYGAVILVWRAYYVALDFGTQGSFLYLDPTREPLRFLAQLPSRLSALLAGQVALPWSEVTSFADGAGPAVGVPVRVLAVGTLALVAWAIVPLWRARPETRFFVVGSILSALPVCATLPADRLLVFTGVGAMAVLAQLVLETSRAGVTRLARGFVVFVHLALAPPLLLVRSRSFAPIERSLLRVEQSVPREGEDVIVVNPPADFMMGYLAVMRAATGSPRPLRMRWLASSEWAVTLTRIDAHTLEARPERGYLGDTTARMMRDPEREPFHVGDKVALKGMTTEVLEVTSDGRPALARFHFDRSLDDPGLWLGRWEHGRAVRMAAPAIGQTVTLPGESVFDAIFE